MSAPAQPFRVELVDFDAARAELHAIREDVFIRGQGVPADLERDALDPICTHALARLLDGRPVGTARLTPDRHVGRMAVMEPWRGSGVGDAVAHDDADGLVTLHARLRQGGRDPLDEVGYLVARIPLSGELDERPITVGLQTGGQVVGEVHGHAGLELGGT